MRRFFFAIKKSEKDDVGSADILIKQICELRISQAGYYLSGNIKMANDYETIIKNLINELKDKRFNAFYDKDKKKILSFFEIFKAYEERLEHAIYTTKIISNETFDSIKTWSFYQIKTYIDFYLKLKK